MLRDHIVWARTDAEEAAASMLRTMLPSTLRAEVVSQQQGAANGCLAAESTAQTTVEPTNQSGELDLPAGSCRDTVTKFTGLIIVAIGVQFALTGIHGFFFAHH
jgi:hypothetical protein